jgi:hypothetical protein
MAMTPAEAMRSVELRRRFAPGGDHEQNLGLACDPSGFAEVGQEILDEVGYQRPAFNWPAPDLPQSNYHAIEAMAVDTLASLGFSREAKSLRGRMARQPPKQDELANLLYRFLDFEPAPELVGPEVEKLKAMAETLGLDPESVGRVKKKKIVNPLAHPRSAKLAQEWKWLVDHAQVRSPFGKTAADELSGDAIAKLSGAWLGQLGRPPGDPMDPALGNRAWFDHQFPMGWIHLDHLHDTAIMTSKMSFVDRVGLMVYEVASKTESGAWSARDVARFGYDHANAYGVRGSALIAEEALDYFINHTSEALGKTTANPPTHPVARHMVRANPDLAGQPEAVLAWGAYMLADPQTSSEIEPFILKQLAKLAKQSSEGANKQGAKAFEAQLEALRLRLASASLALPEQSSSPRPSARRASL